MLTQREYDESELRELRRRLSDVTSPARQVAPSPAGQEYRRKLREDMARVEKQLADREKV